MRRRFSRAFPNGRLYTSAGDREVALRAMRVPQEPRPLGDALEVVARHVDGIGHNLGSGRFFAYIPSGSLHEAAIADYLAAVSNRYAGVGKAAPGAARMEETLLRWLADLIGYPDTAQGDLTSGGSMAALSAVVTAREAHGIRSRDVESCVVYLTGQTHHTFRKALHVAGVGDCQIREIAVDGGQRMSAPALQTQIAADRAAGLRPWFICGSAGTTDVGAIDPLPALAQIAADGDLWFHVDGAYGGAFALCAEGRRRLAGVEHSDSMLLDPHKGLFLPCGTGVLLVRDGQRLFDAYHARGVYMQDIAPDDERSACDLSPELTRPFRGLRLWLPLQVHGARAFAAALEEKLLLAEYFHERVARLPLIEVGPRPDLSVVVFRAVPEHGDADAFNQRLVDAIAEDGRIFLASTRLHGRYTIRMAILNYQSHREDIDLALEIIGATIERLRRD